MPQKLLIDDWSAAMDGLPRNKAVMARHGVNNRKDKMRNLKILGLAVIAVLAMTAVAASAASAAEFTAEKYPVKLTGKQEAGTNKFVVEGGALTTECSNTETLFHGTAEKAVPVLTIEATYKGCTSNLGSGVTVDMNGCDYTFNIGAGATDTWAGNVTIDCPPTKQIEVTGGLCNIDIPAQVLTGGITYTNLTTAKPKKDVTVDIAVKKIKYTMTPIIFCPFSHETRTDGEYISSVTMQAFEDGKVHSEATQVGIDVG